MRWQNGQEWFCEGAAKAQMRGMRLQSVGEDTRGKSEEVRYFGVLLHSHGRSLNAVGKLLGVLATAVMKWVKRTAEEHGAKPEPGSAVIVELDEMWHFLQKKTTSAGYGRRMIVIRTGLLTGNAGVVMLPRSSACWNG
jgi:transposase